ncbi:MAG: histidine kinase dimerization/phospho-acceptor domain-containing protein, partial [Alphaproteobacteria bacterium]|nr:histidine kinase dimerization/phospho-acceptor domain-containing protein [Alphaproteobacteria bacterium]
MNAPDSPRQTPLKLRIKRFLPRSLFGRTLLIFVIPTFIMLAAATYVFFNRHWYTVTNRMTRGLAGDAATVVELLEESTSPEMTAHIERLAREKMLLRVSFAPNAKLPPPIPIRGPIGVIMKHALNDALAAPYVLNMNYAPETIGIKIAAHDGVYTILSPERRVYTPTTQVFILWMTGSSILLTFIALLFMRNQIRPIRRLAAAADAIGKGREVPWFKVEGSSEVRQAGAALMVMRDRLKRQIAQRTAMLAGVSHDLRTPLTRMRLQVELMGATPETNELLSDVAEMEEMLNAYLAFARGEEAEPTAPVDIGQLLEEIASSARRQNPNIALDAPQGLEVLMRRHAMKRCLTNLVANALRYGSRADIRAESNDQTISVTVDDDG